MKIGDKVYLKPVGQAAQYSDKILDYEVKSVGRKYFEVWNGSDNRTIVKFYLENNREVSKYLSNWELHLDKQKILDDIEFAQLISIVREHTNVFHKKPDLTLKQLRGIVHIIDVGDSFYIS